MKKKNIRQIKAPTKGILFYTNNALNMKLAINVRKNLAGMGLPITCVSTKPTNFGDNLILDDTKMKAGEAICRKVLLGLEHMKQDIAYLCEADVFYHPTHFAFTPKKKLTWYYNGNYWFVRLPDGFAIHYDVSPLSGLAVYRKTAIKHFKERLAYIEKNGFTGHIGYEPMTHHRIQWKFSCPFEVFLPPFPNIDITHGANVSYKRWSPHQFIKKPLFWEESDATKIPGWPELPQILGPLYQPKQK